jgi:hypothetical protein
MNDKQYHEQQLIQRHVPLLLNNYSLDVISKIKAEESEWITDDSEGSQENAGVSRGIDFLMCQSLSPYIH